jgi:outer membrane protein assembly factor BamB
MVVISPSGFARASHHSKGEWPQFRGPRAAGVADGAKLPATWDVDKGSNIRWKTAVPGLGHASPIVVGDSLFIVAAQSDDEDPQLRVGLYGDIASVPTEQPHTWRLNCLCKHTGRILWKRNLHEGVPQIKRHTKASHANSTPASDGFHVVVFLGSEGLYCYDVCGNRLWKKDLGFLDSGYYVVPAAQWGFGSSPIIYKNMVIVQCDVQKDSFIAAFDVRSGRELWRTAREDVPTWSTPTIFEGKTRTDLVVNGYKHAGGYDPSTGKELWKLSGGGDIPVPTPVTAHGLVFLSSAHGGKRPLCAIREGASGDITPKDDDEPGEHFAWYQPRSGIYMQTPLVYGDYLYACGDNGLVTCYEARTGNRVYRKRLGNGSTGFTASAIAGDGKIYFTSEDGHIYVVKAGPTFELLATNAMNAVCMATPAISDGQLIVRAEKYVYAIGNPQPVRIRLEPRSLSPGDNPCAQHRPSCNCSKRRAWRKLICIKPH